MPIVDNSPRRLLLVAAAALVDGRGRVLIAQRPADKSLGGLWEFPGGKVEPGEGPEAALARELEEELDVRVEREAMAPFAFASHGYPDFHLLMPLYLVRNWAGTPRAVEAQALAWAMPADLSDYSMPPADLPLVALLQRPGALT
ncbi:MAG: (deoxy)nucleoside triphosphate pyrophosphohydrolase [Hyphomonadaceae bacterium]|nr:(deoxy)nucleoside triphosphate pyrophosphohydrolase [Hyphomonadaceae bacterium]